MTAAEIANLLYRLPDSQLAEVCALLNCQRHGDVPQIYDTTQIILDCDYNAFTHYLNKVLHKTQNMIKANNTTNVINNT